MIVLLVVVEKFLQVFMQGIEFLATHELASVVASVLIGAVFRTISSLPVFAGAAVATVISVGRLTGFITICVTYSLLVLVSREGLTLLCRVAICSALLIGKEQAALAREEILVPHFLLALLVVGFGLTC